MVPRWQRYGIVGARAAEATGQPAFIFKDVGYFHRWSQKEQHEYTPREQEDLDKWIDMVTIDDYSDVRDGEGLAARANAVLENYKAHHHPENQLHPTHRRPAGGTPGCGGIWSTGLYRGDLYSFPTDRKERVCNRLLASNIRRKGGRPNERLVKGKWRVRRTGSSGMGPNPETPTIVKLQ